MSKSQLHLSIDSDLKELAKNSNLNLSQEFEEWVRIRLQRNIAEDIKYTDYPLEKAKLIQEIALLESREELSKREELKEKEETMILKSFLDNIKEFDNLPLNDDNLTKRTTGLIFIFKQRLNKIITTEQAQNMIKEGLK